MAVTKKDGAPETTLTCPTQIYPSLQSVVRISHMERPFGRTSAFVADSCWEARHITQGLDYLLASDFQTDSRNTSAPQDINWRSKKKKLNKEV